MAGTKKEKKRKEQITGCRDIADVTILKRCTPSRFEQEMEGLNFASIAKQQLDFGKFNSRHVFFCLTAKVVESNSRLTSDVKIKSTRYPNAFVVVFPQKKEEILFPTRPQPKSA